MTKYLHEILDIDKLNSLIEEGLISSRPHETLPLKILNYTAQCQYKAVWIHETVTCRGLIINNENLIVARPFQKIFNYGQVRPPNFALTKQPVVTRKMDGSLFIAACYEDTLVTSTRGSFHSEQADFGRMWLKINHPKWLPPQNVTYLFEVIYPENKIVVDYDFSGLVLIAIIDNDTGADLPLWESNWPGQVVDQFRDIKDMQQAYLLATSNKFTHEEGLVACWEQYQAPSFRQKFKHPRYIELHRLFTGTSSKTIWEALVNGTWDEVKVNLPDELYQWADKIALDLNLKFIEYISRVMLEFHAIPKDLTRKRFAEIAHKSEYKAALFKLLDGKDISSMAWMACKPQYVPFKVEDEDVS